MSHGRISSAVVNQSAETHSRVEQVGSIVIAGSSRFQRNKQEFCGVETSAKGTFGNQVFGFARIPPLNAYLLYQLQLRLVRTLSQEGPCCRR